MVNRRNFVLCIGLLIVSSVFAVGQNGPIRIELDASEAARNILHVRETLSVRPGRLHLFYPKWIPGEHKPSGPINDMVNLFITANGKPLEWNRDEVEMYAFHLTIPAGVGQVEVRFDDAAQPGTTASAQLARIKWNRLAIYPRGLASDNIQVLAAMKLPPGWQYATALPTASESADMVVFKPVSFTTLVDSPVMIGRYFKKVPLTHSGILHEMDIAADTPEALAFSSEELAGWKNLIKEAYLMYGARHYNSYHFLLTLSDVGGDEGLEHHESSEDGVGINAFTDEEGQYDLGDLLSHEYTHSWNGKYRRPASLTTPDFEQPMHGDLLWVYEGLTQYLGFVLPARSHLWTPEVFRESVAEFAAGIDVETGRRWRPLVDTARAVQLTYSAPRAWRNARRSAEYYDEGILIWMEVDVLIRQMSGGRRSLDDFLHEFVGGRDTGPMVRTYSLNDIVVALNKVQPYDWSTFLKQRVYTVQPHAPLNGITNGGWKLAYTDVPNIRMAGLERLRHRHSYMYSLGFMTADDGTIIDIDTDYPAAKAGLAPGMKIINVNGKNFSSNELAKVLTDSRRSTKPITVIAENGGFSQTYTIDYHGGTLYPHLMRDETKPDILAEIIKGH